ncbi:MAG: hypothetical protein PHV39_04280 [Methanomicrobium sp.]|nr:hypothetical protein [Methanomicrobium sp.]
MTGENEENTHEKYENSPENRNNEGRILICQNCSNEWIPRNTTSKRWKCPICGKYRVVWKDELLENTPDSLSSHEISQEKIENSHENIEKTDEKKENSHEKTLEKLEKPKKSEFLLNSPGENEEKTDEEKLSEAMEKSGGLSPFAVGFGILGLVIIAGIGYFLSRTFKRKNLKQVAPAQAAPIMNPRVQNVLRRLA